MQPVLPDRELPQFNYYSLLFFSLNVEEHSQYAKKISKHESNHSNKSAVEMAKKKINKMGKDIFLDDYDAEMLFGDSG